MSITKTLRVRTKTGWVTKPAADEPENRLIAEEIDDNFLALEDQVEDKADKVSGHTTDNFAGLDATGNLQDSGSKAADFDTAGSASAVQSNLDTHTGNTTDAHGIDDKVDKITGSSLVADTEIAKIHTQNTDTKLDEGGENEVSAAEARTAVDVSHTQDTDTKLDEGGTNEVSASEITTHIDNTTTAHGIDDKVDKVPGSSLVADTEIAKIHTQNTDTNLGAVGTKATPVDADKVVQRDSANSDALATSTWTQIKAFLKTYFDTKYLLESNNLSDLDNAATARSNLGLGNHVTHNYGTSASTVCEGNDSRLSDARTPTSHGNASHSDIDQSLLTTDSPTFAGLYTTDNVGIGTTNPETKLEVDGDVKIDSSSLIVTGTGSSRPDIFKIHGWSTTHWLSLGYAYQSSSTYTFEVRGDAGSNRDIEFWNYATNTPFIHMQANDGNVGIGTTSPGSKLEVNGKVDITSSYYTAGARNSTMSTSNPSGGKNGDVWYKYE